MKTTLIVCILLWLNQNFEQIVCQSVANIKDVITQLFTTDGYNKRVRPVDDQSEPVPVMIDLFLVGIDGFDEVKQKLTTTGYLAINWIDTELQWDPNNYGGVSRIQVPQTEIWKPDITLQNGKSDMKELGGNWLVVTIENTGDVFWAPYHNFETKCSLDVSYFPFDEQVCDIKFIAWSTYVWEIEIDQGKQGIILEEYEENGEWEITRTNSSQSKTKEEATVIYTLYLKRRPTYTVMNIITPILLLGFLNLFVFVLPADSGEKVGFSVTVLLAFAVFLTIVSDSLPKNSIKVPILSIYLIIEVAISTLCVMLTITELRFFHRDDDHHVGTFWKKFVRLVWKIQITGKHAGLCSCCTKNKIEDTKLHVNMEWKMSDVATVESSTNEKVKDITKINELQEPEVNWRSVTNALDYVLFWILFLIQMSALIAFFLITTYKLPY